MQYRILALALTVSWLTVRDAGRSILPPMHGGLLAFSRFRLKDEAVRMVWRAPSYWLASSSTTWHTML